MSLERFRTSQPFQLFFPPAHLFPNVRRSWYLRNQRLHDTEIIWNSAYTEILGPKVFQTDND